MTTLDWLLCFTHFKKNKSSMHLLFKHVFHFHFKHGCQMICLNMNIVYRDLSKYHFLNGPWSGDGFNHNLALEFILKIYYHKILWLASFAFKPQNELHWSSLGSGSRPSFSRSLGHIVWSSTRVQQTTFSATKINCIMQAN